MNFIYRWRLLSKIVDAVSEQFGSESADAIGRFKGLNGSAWVSFTKNLKLQKLSEDFDLAIGLLWFSVNAPTTDRIGFQMKRACFITYCGITNKLFYSDPKSWRENAAKKRAFNSAIEELDLPVDFEPTDKELGMSQ